MKPCATRGNEARQFPQPISHARGMERRRSVPFYLANHDQWPDFPGFRGFVQRLDNEGYLNGPGFDRIVDMPHPLRRYTNE